MSRFWTFLTKGLRPRPTPGTSSSQTSSQASSQTQKDDGDASVCSVNTIKDSTYEKLDPLLRQDLKTNRKNYRLVLVPDEETLLSLRQGQRTYRNYNSFHNSYADARARDSVFYGAASALLLGQIVRYVIRVVQEKNLKKRYFCDNEQNNIFSFPGFQTKRCILPEVSALPSVSFRSTAHAASNNEDGKEINSGKLTSQSSTSLSVSQDKSAGKPLLREDDLEEFYTSTKRCLGMTYNVEGLKSYKDGDYRNAFQLFKLGGAGGYVKAQFNLGICYQQGKGTKQDIKQAKKEYNRAALQGHKVAQYNLALILLEESNLASVTRALLLLERAAENGLVEAQALGGSYYAQPGVHQNMKKAVKLFKLASEQEDALSTYHLAECYEHGLGGLDVDMYKAFDLYASAASSEHQEAYYKMARILHNGCPEIERNEDLALEMFKKAEELGHKESALMVKKIEKRQEIEAKAQNKSQERQTDNKLLALNVSHILSHGLFNKLTPLPAYIPENETMLLHSFSNFPVVNFPINRHMPSMGLHRVASWPSHCSLSSTNSVSSVKPK